MPKSKKEVKESQQTLLETIGVIIVLLVIAGGSIWYFVFSDYHSESYKPKPKPVFVDQDCCDSFCDEVSSGVLKCEGYKSLYNPKKSNMITCYLEDANNTFKQFVYFQITNTSAVCKKTMGE